jgi:hypothetical protein
MLSGQRPGLNYAQGEGTTPSAAKIGGATGQRHRTPRSLPSHDCTAAPMPVRPRSPVRCGTGKRNEVRQASQTKIDNSG